MRGFCNNLIGQRFGRLLVLELVGIDKWYNRKWLCQCDCGEEVIVLGSHLKNGNTKSCTCLARELSAARLLTHGQSRKTTYRIWDGLRRRCDDPKNPGYKWYGAKGISVCDKWQKFAGFFEDMGVRPSGLTIERKDSKGDYEKENCEWATITKNLRNRPGYVKLSMEKAREIRNLLSVGIMSQRAIGRMFNVARSNIRQIRLNKLWKENFV